MPEIVVVSARPEEEDEAITARKRYEEEFLAKARDRFKEVSEAEAEMRREWLDSIQFYDGQQWPDHIAKAREAENRPCLTINRIPGLVHAVSNEIRQNKPAPKVSPVDDQGDTETAEVLQGIYRYIERLSNAAAVRSYASFIAIITGLSYYRIVTDYSHDPGSWDQDIYIRRIKNPLSVYMDPACKEPDCCDANYCFVIEDLTEDEFKSQYPDAEVSSLEEFRSIGDGSPLWGTDKIRVAEYFTVEYVDEPQVKLQDNSIVPLAEAPEGVPILEQRMRKRRVVTWTKITAAEILEQREWAGYYIPVVRIVGEEYDVDGTTKYVGMVRAAKDPQRMLNYWETAKTEQIALATRAPWLVAEGQIENHETEWQQSNTRNFAYLQYKATDVAGRPVPPPQRQVSEPPIQAISMAQGGAVDHLKATTGVYDASLGARSNETTGIAIQQRLAQTGTTTYHYIDHVATAITYEAKAIVDLIPKIYDRPGRVIRIIGEDDTEQEVMLNQPHMDRNGMQRMYALGTGRYDVAVDIGPSYATKRQESVESMTAFAQAAPQLVPQYADLYVKAMDWPGAKEIAERVRPPGIPSDDQPWIPPQAAMQMQQISQENEQLKATVQQMQQIILGKQTEMESRERIAMADNQTKLQLAQMQAQIDLLMKRADTSSREQIAGLNAFTQRGMQSRDLSSEAMLQDEQIRSTESIKAAEMDSKEAIALLNAESKIESAKQKTPNPFRQQ
jgi:hypothetical protein